MLESWRARIYRTRHFLQGAISMATVVTVTYKTSNDSEVTVNFESLQELHTWRNTNTDKNITSETFKPHVYDTKFEEC